LDVASLSKQQETQASILELQKQLGKAQLQKLDSLNARKQLEFIFSRSLLLFALNRHVNAEQEVDWNQSISWDIVERPQLPPLVMNSEADSFQFSISHSHSFVAIACCYRKENQQHSQQQIGFDIQQTKQFKSFEQGLQAAEYFCHVDELEGLSALAGEKQTHAFNSTFTQFWSMKEAFFKAQESSIHNEQLTRTHFQNCKLNQANCLSSYLVGQDEQEYQITLYNPFLATDVDSAESAVEVNSVELNLNNGRLETSLQSQKLEWQGFCVRQ